MSKEITIIPSDESIKFMWEFEKELMDKGLKEVLTYDEYYKKHKRPLKALFG